MVIGNAVDRRGIPSNTVGARRARGSRCLGQRGDNRRGSRRRHHAPTGSSGARRREREKRWASGDRGEFRSWRREGAGNGTGGRRAAVARKSKKAAVARLGWIDGVLFEAQ